MAMAGDTMAGLDTGELPRAVFTHTSVVDGRVEPTVGMAPTTSLADVYAWLAEAGRVERGASSGVGVDLDISGPIEVQTTYFLQHADPLYRFGWHYDNGPVIFTVTSGTLTILDDTCQTFDLVAGHTCIGSSGQVLDAVLLPEKNPGVPAVGWFTTRLSPVGAAGPIAIEAPCEM
jgi:hypothetical protein